MLDLNFVRGNLELVEAKLRSRGQDPASLLGGFRELDKERRARITQAETLQAQRNKISQDVARSRKAGEDASALMEQTKELKQQTEALEKSAAEAEEACARC